MSLRFILPELFSGLCINKKESTRLFINKVTKVTDWCNVVASYYGMSCRIHISVQIPHQDGMLPLVSTMPLHNLHFLLSESIYRHQHVCSNLVTIKDLQGISGEPGQAEAILARTAVRQAPWLP